MIPKLILTTLIPVVFGYVYGSDVHIGDDIIIMTMYENECITLQKDKAYRLPRMSVSELCGLTNSVENFMLRCKAGEFSIKTNSCQFVDAYYSKFESGDNIWWYALCLTYFHNVQRRLVQFAILPNGEILDAMPPKNGEIYIITNEPIRISARDRKLLGGNKNVYYMPESDLTSIYESRMRLLITALVMVMLVVAVVIWKHVILKSLL